MTARTIDTRFSIRGDETVPRNIVVVGIDDATFSSLNQQFPFPRADYGKVISNIFAQHPAAIAVDVTLSEASPGGAAASQNDECALLDALLIGACMSNNPRPGAGPLTVFSSTVTNAMGAVPFLGSAQGTNLLALVGAHPASTLFPPEPDQSIRRVTYSVAGLRTFAVVTAGVATQHPISRAEFDGSSQWIDYVAPGGAFPHIDFAKVYRNQMSPGFFRGRVAIVGETAPSLQDLHSTPVDPFMSGPEVQANAIYTALRGFPLESVPGWINICLIVLSALVPVLAARRSAGIMAAATLLAAVILVVAAQFAFEAGWVVAVVYPLGTLVIAAYGALSHRLHYASVDREHELDRFKRPRAPLSHGHRAE